MRESAWPAGCQCPPHPVTSGDLAAPRFSRGTDGVMVCRPSLTLRVADAGCTRREQRHRSDASFIARAGSVFSASRRATISARCAAIRFGEPQWMSQACESFPSAVTNAFPSAHLGRHRLRGPRRRRQGLRSRTARPSADEAEQHCHPVNRIIAQLLATWCSSTNVPVLADAEPPGARGLTRDARRAMPGIKTSSGIGGGRHGMRLAGHRCRIRNSLPKMTPAQTMVIVPGISTAIITARPPTPSP